MQDGESIRYRVNIDADDDDHAGELARQLEGEGAEEVAVRHDGAGFFPIPIFGALVVGYMSLAGFIAFLKDFSEKRSRRGVLIKFDSDGEATIQKIDIPYGQVILVTKDGQWLRYEQTTERLGDLVAKLAGGLVPGGGTETSKAEVEEETKADKAADDTKPADGDDVPLT